METGRRSKLKNRQEGGGARAKCAQESGVRNKDRRTVVEGRADGRRTGF